MTSAPPGAAAAGALTRCRLAGFGPGTKDSPLWGLLRGMCTSYDRIPIVHEHGFNIPLENGTKGLTAQLIAQPPTTDSSAAEAQRTCYVLRQQNAPKRGPVYQQLPADVIEVYESVLYDSHALQFLLALGAEQVYHVSKQGIKYTCMQQGREVEVMVYTVINSLDARTHSGRAPMCLPTDHLLVETTLLVGEDQTEAEAARALAAFAERLLPLVTLKKFA